MEENINKAIADFSATLEKHLREIQQMLILVPNSMHGTVSRFSKVRKNILHDQCFDDQHKDIQWMVLLNILHNQYGGPVPSSCNPAWLFGGWTTSLLRPDFDFLISCNAIDDLRHTKIIKFSDGCIVHGEIYFGDLVKYSVSESTMILILAKTKQNLKELQGTIYSEIVRELEKTGKDNSWPFSYTLCLISAYEELLSKNAFVRERIVKSHKEISEIANGLHATQSFSKSKIFQRLRERLEVVAEELK